MQTEQDFNVDLFVSNALNKYLGQTRLSMEQVAKRWNVSSAMLSLVRNNKKSVGIDLGLKILRESGEKPVKRKEWLERKVYSLSDESKIVDSDIRNEHKITKIKSSIAEQLGQSKILLDIFLDIALAEDKGLSYNSILKFYGERGILEASTLLTADLCRLKDSRYFINEVDNIFAYDKKSSFEVVHNLIREQRLNFLNEEFKGKLEFDVTDVTDEGYQKLKDLQKEYQREIRKVLKENQSHRIHGGLRVFTQSIVSILKTTSLGLILCLASSQDNYAGGVTGTVDDDYRLPTKVEFGDKLVVPLGRFKSLIIKGERANIGSTNFRFRKSTVNTNYFPTKEEAIRSALNKQQDIAFKSKNRDYQRIISNSPYRGTCDNINLGSKKPINKNFFRFNGFKVEESYDHFGNQRYHGKINVDFLCKEK